MKTRSQPLVGFARVLSGLMILVLLLATAGSVSALSTVDTIHTGVGLIVVRFPDGNLWAGDAHGITCSGILIAPKVFLTAGHCTRGLQSWLDRGHHSRLRHIRDAIHPRCAAGRCQRYGDFIHIRAWEATILTTLGYCCWTPQ